LVPEKCPSFALNNAQVFRALHYGRVAYGPAAIAMTLPGFFLRDWWLPVWTSSENQPRQLLQWDARISW